MAEYICDLCKKTFNQKIDFTRHKNKKSPCISLNEMQKLTQTKEEKSDIKSQLISVFKNCLNILRDNEGLTGEKALRNLSYLLILKLLEPHLETEINIDEYEYDFSHIEDDAIDKHKKKLLLIVRFTNLSKEKEDNIPTNMKYLWSDILSVHPITKNIFLKDKTFDIQHKNTYTKLITKLVSLNLSNTDYDILGNAYEEVIQDIMTGKVLGQFFTQPLIKKMMVKLINPQIHQDGKIDSCGDPTMGTGGFLITYLQYILEQAKTKNITPDWNFIKTEGLYGKELEPDTYQLAVSNMLISSGHMFGQLERGDSIRKPIERKFDNILANPPFGIKGLKYDDFESPLKSEYIPIKSDNAVSLFIQAIIYMLKINGKCAVVLPDGQDLFSKSNTTLVAIREYLMKTCDLKEIIYLPSGIFTYTSIKTCVFYFIKKKEGKEALDTIIKLSKTNKAKETGRDYKFTKTHQTTKVKFYDYNPYEDIKNLLVEVPIEKIALNSYALNYAEYMKEEVEEEYNDDIEIKTLGEICEFLSKSKRQASYGNKEGLYPFFKSSNKVDSYVDEADYNDESIIIGTGGNANIKYSKKFSCSTDNFVIKFNKEILTKYIYYYLFFNINILEKGFIGVSIKHISKEYLNKIKIPLPSIEKQKEVIKYLDFIYEKCMKTSNDKITELKQLNEYCLNNQKLLGNNTIKTLGEISKINYGKRITQKKDEGATYPAYGGGGVMSYKVDNYNRDGITYKISRDGLSKHNCISKIYGKLFLNDTALTLETINKDEIDNYYIGEYLLSQKNYIYNNCTHGTAQLHIDIDKLMKIKIPLPVIQIQKEIIEYCENNDTLIKQLEKEIKQNKKQATQFISTIIKNSNIELSDNLETSDTEENNYDEDN
jgi:type I restriction-modification system DNA methylase subunit